MLASRGWFTAFLWAQRNPHFDVLPSDHLTLICISANQFLVDRIAPKAPFPAPLRTLESAADSRVQCHNLQAEWLPWLLLQKTLPYEKIRSIKIINPIGNARHVRRTLVSAKGAADAAVRWLQLLRLCLRLHLVDVYPRRAWSTPRPPPPDFNSSGWFYLKRLTSRLYGNAHHSSLFPWNIHDPNTASSGP